MKEGLENGGEEKLEEPKAKFESLQKLIKEVLRDKADKVVPNRITDFPRVLVVEKLSWAANSQRTTEA